MICKKHGEVKGNKVSGRTNPRCNKCQSDAVTRRRKKLKLMALEYKGDICSKCGYNKCNSALEFHHLDPNEKEFSLGEKGHTMSWNKLKIELDKCILVCSNCHREIHSTEFSSGQ